MAQKLKSDKSNNQDQSKLFEINVQNYILFSHYLIFSSQIIINRAWTIFFSIMNKSIWKLQESNTDSMELFYEIWPLQTIQSNVIFTAVYMAKLSVLSINKNYFQKPLWSEVHRNTGRFPIFCEFTQFQLSRSPRLPRNYSLHIDEMQMGYPKQYIIKQVYTMHTIEFMYTGKRSGTTFLTDEVSLHKFPMRKEMAQRQK